jgi:hypothetical protein
MLTGSAHGPGAALWQDMHASGGVHLKALNAYNICNDVPGHSTSHRLHQLTLQRFSFNSFLGLQGQPPVHHNLSTPQSLSDPSYQATSNMDAQGPALDNTLGASFIGLVTSCVIYGITLLQTYSYFLEYADDRNILKSFVSSLVSWVSTA